MAPGHAGGYRPHLDGIRALAVAMVIAFHLGYPWIPGGFVGVDVFFVLSGYLITGILLREATDTGRVRLGRFFARRVRRLLPASILVIGFVVLVGRWLMDAAQQADLRLDVIWSALYSANWRFATKGGDYFAPGDVPSPLVHYWSLAVEEQFYLVWPLLFAALVWGAKRAGLAPARVLLAAAVALGLVSAAASVLTVGTPISYYGTHVRAHQLLAGAILAMAVHLWPSLDRSAGPGGARSRRLVAVGGLVLAPLLTLGWLGHSIEGAARYPGWPGVAVTVASVALIAGLDLTPPGRHQRLIGARLPAAVGRWSYSLYIWHWPIVVFAPVLADRWSRPWIAERSSILVAIAVLAGASYVAIERPVRFQLAPRARQPRVIAVGLTFSIAVAAGAWAWPTQPFAGRALAAVADSVPAGPCPYGEAQWAASNGEPCVLRDGSGPTIALVGDSHAHQWEPALVELARHNDARLIRVTRVGCPAPDVTVFSRNEQGRDEVDDVCTEWRRSLYPQVVDRYDPDVIFLATRGYVSGLVTEEGRIQPRQPEHLTTWAAGWDWTLNTLTSGSGTVVLSTILPTMPERIPACLAEHGDQTTRCDFPLADDERLGPYNDVIRDLPRHHGGMAVIDPVPMVCPDGICPAISRDIIVHRDNNHLSATFVRTRADEIAALFEAVGVDLKAPDPNDSGT